MVDRRPVNKRAWTDVVVSQRAAQPASYKDSKRLPIHGVRIEERTRGSSMRSYPAYWSHTSVPFHCGASPGVEPGGSCPPPRKAVGYCDPRPGQTILGNLKRTIAGAHHSFKFRKYADSYFAGFAYRFNRRFDLKCLVARMSNWPNGPMDRPAGWLW
jgi:hypothetical protein